MRVKELFINKSGQRLSLIDPMRHKLHGILSAIPEAHYLVIKKINNSYLIVASKSIELKILDQVHLISSTSGYTLDHGEVSFVFKASELPNYSGELIKLSGKRELYFYVESI